MVRFTHLANQVRRIGGTVSCMAILMLLANLSRVAAAETETRDFSVMIDRSKAGDYQMEINLHEDGSVAVATQANIRVTYWGVPVYSYLYVGMEKWKDGKLKRLESSTNDDGKRFKIHTVTDSTALRISVNGEERAVQPDVWLTTYWRLPDAKLRNQRLVLLDADTGQQLTATLSYVGNDQITVCGQPQTCAHYRLIGDKQADLWFDAQERLVRQEYVEDKHNVVHELTRIRH